MVFLQLCRTALVYAEIYDKNYIVTAECLYHRHIFLYNLAESLGVLYCYLWCHKVANNFPGKRKALHHKSQANCLQVRTYMRPPKL